MSDVESSSTTATFDVHRGRVPTKTLLLQEARIAEEKGYRSIKVLTSGPQPLVDGVLAESRAVNWKLFDAEEFSFEF